MSQFLSVNAVSKAYPGESLGAVNNVSFSVERGEIFSLVGKSGSGKSTLLRMLAGLLRPDSGSIIFKEEPLANPETQLIAGHAAIKMVFQDFDLMPNMTVTENLRYPLLAYDKEFTTARVQELLTLCRIEALAGKLPRELSGGQQQRVALARALADEPELLLMDEPFSQLDPVNKRALLQEILRILKTEQVALVLVTHDTRDALMVSDRIGFLQQGGLIQTGTPVALYDEPVNLEVASFFGTVNVFSPEEAKRYMPDIAEVMRDKGASNVAIRAEHVQWEPHEQAPHPETRLMQEFFLGDSFLVQVQLAGEKEVFLISQASLVHKGGLYISFPAHKLFFFLD